MGKDTRYVIEYVAKEHPLAKMYLYAMNPRTRKGQKYFSPLFTCNLQGAFTFKYKKPCEHTIETLKTIFEHEFQSIQRIDCELEYHLRIR